MIRTPKKQRLSVYLDPDVMQALVAYSARRDQSRSVSYTHLTLPTKRIV